MALFTEIIKSIFPEYCIACERKGASLCALCERAIILRPMMHEEWLTSLFEYHQPIVKKAIQDLKYHHRRGIADYFGNALFREFFSQLARHPEQVVPICFIPIPGSAAGNAERGYNHAGEIAKALVAVAARSRMPMCVLDHVLLKTREPKPQARIDERCAREKNVEGVFEVRDKKLIAGKHIVLIDDVITTGETMKAARKVLLQAGAKTVIGIGVAH